jgi:hypothetical protein
VPISPFCAHMVLQATSEKHCDSTASIEGYYGRSLTSNLHRIFASLLRDSPEVASERRCRRKVSVVNRMSVSPCSSSERGSSRGGILAFAPA